MPQMAPLSWLILFIIFSIVLILFNIMNYFCYTPTYSTKKSLSTSTTNNSLNWKW